jgi:hypothetical protein
MLFANFSAFGAISEWFGYLAATESSLVVFFFF